MNPFAERRWDVGHGRSLSLGPRGRIMAILNVTPDSFSDGGAHSTVAKAVDAATTLVADGADVIDIGGESTRPGAEPISGQMELDRVLPVIEALAARTPVLLSIDTSRAETARLAHRAGAHIVNDVTGLLGDAAMVLVLGETDAGFVAMHNSRPEFRPERSWDVMEDQIAFWHDTAQRLRLGGIAETRVVFDPGIGFGKDADENAALINRLSELTSEGPPILLGASRKRFVGAATGRAPDARDVGTAVTTAFGRHAGAALFRVHDVAANIDALRMTEALMAVGSRN